MFSGSELFELEHNAFPSKQPGRKINFSDKEFLDKYMNQDIHLNESIQSAKIENHRMLEAKRAESIYQIKDEMSDLEFYPKLKYEGLKGIENEEENENISEIVEEDKNNIYPESMDPSVVNYRQYIDNLSIELKRQADKVEKLSEGYRGKYDHSIRKFLGKKNRMGQIDAGKKRAGGKGKGKGEKVIDVVEDYEGEDIEQNNEVIESNEENEEINPQDKKNKDSNSLEELSIRYLIPEETTQKSLKQEKKVKVKNLLFDEEEPKRIKNINKQLDRYKPYKKYKPTKERKFTGPMKGFKKRASPITVYNKSLIKDMKPQDFPERIESYEEAKNKLDSMNKYYNNLINNTHKLSKDNIFETEEIFKNMEGIKSWINRHPQPTYKSSYTGKLGNNIIEKAYLGGETHGTDLINKHKDIDYDEIDAKLYGPLKLDKIVDSKSPRVPKTIYNQDKYDIYNQLSDEHTDLRRKIDDQMNVIPDFETYYKRKQQGKDDFMNLDREGEMEKKTSEYVEDEMEIEEILARFKSGNMSISQFDTEYAKIRDGPFRSMITEHFEYYIYIYIYI